MRACSRDDARRIRSWTLNHSKERSCRRPEALAGYGGCDIERRAAASLTPEVRYELARRVLLGWPASSLLNPTQRRSGGLARALTSHPLLTF